MVNVNCIYLPHFNDSYIVVDLDSYCVLFSILRWVLPRIDSALFRRVEVHYVQTPDPNGLGNDLDGEEAGVVHVGGGLLQEAAVLRAAKN